MPDTPGPARRGPHKTRGWLARSQDRAVLKAALSVLDSPPRKRSKLIKTILADAAALTAADPSVPQDKAAREHTASAYLILAADRRLAREGYPPDKRHDALAHGVSTPGRSIVHAATRMLMMGRRDRFTALADYTETHVPRRYGASFEIETSERSDSVFVQSIRRCAFHDIFTRNGAPHLTSVMCAFDRMWIDAIDPTKDGVRFDRPTTLAGGGSSCRFEFRRVRPDPTLATGQSSD